MAPPRAMLSNNTLHPPTTPYSLLLLSEYAQTLDAIPLDLSRTFADLRELDAVLTATVSSVTSKTHQLIDLIESNDSSIDAKKKRLWLLGEIAEEANKIRPGADDKIRLATQAADTLLGQQSYLTSLISTLPDFDSNMLVKRTRYPHVAPRAFLVPQTYESGRRRRAPNGQGLLVGPGGEVSPNKRRRVVQDEDLDYGRTPRKEKTDGVQRRRPRKVDRPPSPSESILSIASPMPRHTSGNTVRTSNSAATSTAPVRGAPLTVIAKKRRQVAESLFLESKLIRKDKDNQHTHDYPPSSSAGHPSLASAEPPHDEQRDVEQRKNGRGGSTANGNGRDKRDADWNNGVGRHADAPASANAPGARASTQSSLTPMNASAADETSATGVLSKMAVDGAIPDDHTDDSDGAAAGDNEGDGDDTRLYCYCQNISYGEMLACDDDNCRIEWFHLGCVGMDAPPAGSWFCDDCVQRRAGNRRSSRGGKKKGGNTRTRGGS